MYYSGTIWVSEGSLKEGMLTEVKEMNKGVDVLSNPSQWRAVSSQTCRTIERWGHNCKGACREHPGGASMKK